jgi:hypothetical protein
MRRCSPRYRDRLIPWAHISTNPVSDHLEAEIDVCNNRIAYTGLSRRRRCLEWPETEMSCIAGDRDVLNGRRLWCLVWPETVMSGMAGDGDISYGRRRLLTLVRADGIQPYLYIHIYTGLVALLDRIQSSFSIITIFQQVMSLAPATILTTNALFISYD